MMTGDCGDPWAPLIPGVECVICDGARVRAGIHVFASNCGRRGATGKPIQRAMQVFRLNSEEIPAVQSTDAGLHSTGGSAFPGLRIPAGSKQSLMSAMSRSVAGSISRAT